MNKPKAPKDMTTTEFVEAFVAHMNELDEHIYTKNELRAFLTKPAPNPFTPDQLAVFRELQRDGYKYAAADSDLDVFAYRYKPRRARSGNEWLVEEDEVDFALLPYSFLQSMLSPNDPEPLCFADYAPLEGADK